MSILYSQCRNVTFLIRPIFGSVGVKRPWLAALTVKIDHAPLHYSACSTPLIFSIESG